MGAPVPSQILAVSPMFRRLGSSFQTTRALSGIILLGSVLSSSIPEQHSGMVRGRGNERRCSPAFPAPRGREGGFPEFTALLGNLRLSRPGSSVRPARGSCQGEIRSGSVEDGRRKEAVPRGRSCCSGLSAPKQHSCSSPASHESQFPSSQQGLFPLPRAERSQCCPTGGSESLPIPNSAMGLGAGKSSVPKSSSF